MADKITFFKSYRDAAMMLPDDDRLEFYDALLAYAFDGEEPVFDGMMEMAWTLIKPHINQSMKLSEAGRNGAKKTNSKPQQEDDAKAETACRTAGRNGQPEQGAETGGRAEADSGGLSENKNKKKKEKGFGSTNQNQNPSPVSLRGGNAALPKGAAPTAEQDGKSSDIAVVRAQLVAIQAELEHDPSNTYFAREGQRLTARLRQLESREVRR